MKRFIQWVLRPYSFVEDGTATGGDGTSEAVNGIILEMSGYLLLQDDTPLLLED